MEDCYIRQKHIPIVKKLLVAIKQKISFCGKNTTLCGFYMTLISVGNVLQALFQQCPPHIVATVTLDFIVVTLTSEHIATVTLDTIVTFIILLVVLLISSMMWHKNTFGNLVYSKEYTFPILLYY
jgi:hypothetical protein